MDGAVMEPHDLRIGCRTMSRGVVWALVARCGTGGPHASLRGTDPSLSRVREAFGARPSFRSSMSPSNHDPHELLESRLRLPPELPLRLRRVPAQVEHLVG